MKEFGFWDGQSLIRTRPIDTVVTKDIPAGQVSEFVGGCRQIYAYLKSINPDIIFVPERSASPIIWTVQAFADLEDNSFVTMSLPLGTHTDIHQGFEQKASFPEKEKIVEQAVLYAWGQLGDIKKPVLIDEVQRGSTIQRAARFLSENLGPVPINVVAVIDTRSHDKTMARGFKSLVEGRRPNLKASTFTLPLFFIDRQAFLNHILAPSDASAINPRQEAQMQMILHNVEASNFFQNLVLAFDNPRSLKKAIERIKSPSQRPSRSNAAQQRLYLWLEALFSDQRSLRNKADQTSILNWLEEFIQSSRS